MKECFSIQEINEKEFEIFYKEGFVFLNFFSEDCMSSLVMEPIIEDLFSEFNEKIKFVKMYLENNKDLIKKLEIQRTPSFVLIKDGRILDKFSGEKTFEEIEERLKRFII
ncbi:thioredoxin family protein [Candidatus Woesearchaeota archaeon]|jgi:thioredoxin 1|nr:thioredoxin family protein [Candidatus Woesearchaeota archaeon]